MFDLEKIHHGMASANAVGGNQLYALEELESHLREEFQRQIRRKRADAFEIAPDKSARLTNHSRIWQN